MKAAAHVPLLILRTLTQLAVEGTARGASHRRGAAQDERVAALLPLVEQGRALLGEGEEVDVVRRQFASSPTLILYRRLVGSFSGE